MNKLKTKICACALCMASFIAPTYMSIVSTPHPDHPGHVQGVS